jgi:dipeptidyl aminopeptidase/acylaminoacyl peptidase
MKRLFRIACVVPLGVLVGATGSANDPVAVSRTVLQKAKAQAESEPRAALKVREDFLRAQVIGQVHLSPDGRFLSFHRRTQQGADVVLQDAVTGVRKRIAAGVHSVETNWSGDGRRLWIADDQGLAVFEVAGAGAKRVLKWDPRRSQRFWALDARAPGYALIYEKVVERGAERHRYLRVDPQGRTRLLLDVARPLRGALLNENGDLAYTAAFDGPGYETVIRRHAAAATQDLLRCNTIEDCRLVGYNKSQRTLWILSQHGEDKLALRRWREGSQRWDTEHRDPASVADADDILWSASQQNWRAIAYHGARVRWYGNGDARALIAAVQRQLPDANLHLSPSNDARTWLVRAQRSDRALDRHYLYRKDQNRLYPLFSRENAATPHSPDGVAMHPVSYRARDGMLLHGYVMLPRGIRSAKAPLIAWLHGGPVTRIYDTYDPVTQLLVNRGYAVFIPNFRASTGYGLRYVLAAKGDVGNGRVLGDIIDGMDFVLSQGIGDRSRQAVMGMSFGGYASLLAISHHPARFRVAFAGAPPTEYGWIKEWQADHESKALRAEGPPLSLQFQKLGFLYTDAAWRQKMLRESPIAALGSVRAPAYIWAGARDDRVPLKSVVSYAGKARQLGKPLTLLIDPAGGHVPATMIGTQACLYLMELAAHRHLGGGLSPVSPELQSFLKRNVRIE